MEEKRENEITSRLRDQFEDRCETLNGLIFQTREQWLGKRAGRGGFSGKWGNKSAELIDDEIGIKVPHWKEIPYVNETSEANLAEDIGFARELKDKLAKNFETGQFDLAFSESWGLFCSLVGGLETLLSAKPEKLSTARALVSGHVQEDKRAQKLWFSLLFLELQKDEALKTRAQVEDAIVEIINYCIKVDLGSGNGFGQNWFRQLLGDPKKKLEHHLSSAFSDKKFSIGEIEKTARNHAYDIPTLEGLPRLNLR